MNAGKTIFAQLMDFLPWSTFDRIVARYEGDRAVRTLSCAAQYRAMAFAQLIPIRKKYDSWGIPKSSHS
jgi:hypothetical protein